MTWTTKNYQLCGFSVILHYNSANKRYRCITLVSPFTSIPHPHFNQSCIIFGSQFNHLPDIIHIIVRHQFTFHISIVVQSRKTKKAVSKSRKQSQLFSTLSILLKCHQSCVNVAQRSSICVKESSLKSLKSKKAVSNKKASTHQLFNKHQKSQ